MGGLASELPRKVVHIAMGALALALRWLTPAQAAACALAAVIFNAFLLHRLTGRTLLRDHEKPGGFSLGILLYPAAVLALILVFRSRLDLAAAAWGLLAFGDGMATVAGLLLGGPGLPWNRAKSWSGFVAFVLFGTLASAFLMAWVGMGGELALGDLRYAFYACLGAALGAAIAESLPTGIDDNVVVPLVGGSLLYAASLVEPAVLAQAWGAIGRNAAWGAAINAVLAVGAHAARGVDLSGAISGWALGTVLFAVSGWRGFVMLLCFFVLGTAATKAGHAKKVALGIAQEKGGRRSAKNAFANATAGVLFGFLAVATPYPQAFGLALVAAFATAASDTVASEIGQAYGKRHYLVTTFRRVGAGTDGAVSIEGTVAGVLASIVLALVSWGTGLISGTGAGITVAAAFAGTTLESYLGATFERMKLIDNELVNFVNTVAGGVAAVLLHHVI